MNIFIIVCIISIICLPLLAIVIRKAILFQSLPSPGLLEYLPGGIIFPMFKDVGLSSKVITNVMKKYGPVGHFWLGPHHVIFSTNPDDVLEIISNPIVFARPIPMTVLFSLLTPSGLLLKNGQEHRQVRRKLQQHFTPSMLRGFHEKMMQAVDEICDTLKLMSIDNAADPCYPPIIDLTHEVATVTIRVMTNIAFGSKMTKKQRDDFGNLMDNFLTELSTEATFYPLHQSLEPLGSRKKLKGIMKEIRIVCNKFIQDRLGETKEEESNRPADVLDAILAVSNGDVDQIFSYTCEFAVSGSHTSSLVIAWAIYELCCNPKAAAKFDTEIQEHVGDKDLNEPISLEDLDKMTYVRKIWKEVTRLHSVAPLFWRTANKDITLKGSGIKLSEGTQVIVSSAMMHRDERIWNESDKFKPERWGESGESKEGDRVVPGGYFPFGLGPKSCPGKHLAEYEGMVLLIELFRKFQFQLPCKPDEVVKRSGWTDAGRYSSKRDENYDMGIPVIVKMR